MKDTRDPTRNKRASHCQRYLNQKPDQRLLAFLCSVNNFGWWHTWRDQKGTPFLERFRKSEKRKEKLSNHSAVGYPSALYHCFHKPTNFLDSPGKVSMSCRSFNLVFIIPHLLSWWSVANCSLLSSQSDCHNLPNLPDSSMTIAAWWQNANFTHWLRLAADLSRAWGTPMSESHSLWKSSVRDTAEIIPVQVKPYHS